MDSLTHGQNGDSPFEVKSQIWFTAGVKRDFVRVHREVSGGFPKYIFQSVFFQSVWVQCVLWKTQVSYQYKMVVDFWCNKNPRCWFNSIHLSSEVQEASTASCLTSTGAWAKSYHLRKNLFISAFKPFHLRKTFPSDEKLLIWEQSFYLRKRRVR